MSRLRLLTFDVKDTLVKVRGSPGRTYTEVARAHGIDVSEAAVKQVYRRVWDEKQKKYPVYGHKQGMTNREWWHEFIRSVIISAGFVGKSSDLGKVCDSLYDGYAQSPNWELIKNAKETLEYFKSSGIKLGVVSNFDERLDTIMRVMGLHEYFSFFVTSSNEKVAKPDPEIFRRALSMGKESAEVSGHIGDDLECVYLCPKRLGIQPFLFYPSGKIDDQQFNDVEKQFIVKDLIELKRLIVV